jgi:hypothetical protein
VHETDCGYVVEKGDSVSDGLWICCVERRQCIRRAVDVERRTERDY